MSWLTQSHFYSQIPLRFQIPVAICYGKYFEVVGNSPDTAIPSFHWQALSINTFILINKRALENKELCFKACEYFFFKVFTFYSRVRLVSRKSHTYPSRMYLYSLENHENSIYQEWRADPCEGGQRIEIGGLFQNSELILSYLQHFFWKRWFPSIQLQHLYATQNLIH